MTGRIKSFSYKKGYGFILSDIGECFFRWFDCLDNTRKIKEGEKVSFKPLKSTKGLRATEVHVI